MGALWDLLVLRHHPLDLNPWDGNWCLESARHGYPGVDDQMKDAYRHRTLFTPMAFFPRYAIIFAIMARGLSGDYVASGVLVSVAAGPVAATGVARRVGCSPAPGAPPSPLSCCSPRRHVE